MCGIVGMITYNKSGFFLKDKDLFQNLLVVNSLRGSHSTGVFGGKINGNVDYCKVTGGPHELINHPDAKQVWDKMISKYRFMVGHGRHATRGKITSENAHPFQVDHITMVHNGTVFSSKQVDTFKHDVDSKALCAALASHDAKEVLRDINGAYAIVWHDALKDTLNIAHNKERPMSIGFTETGDVIFSSEQNILKLVAGRQEVKFKELLYLPVDEIWTFKAHMDEPIKEKIPAKVSYYSYTPKKEEQKQLPFEEKKSEIITSYQMGSKPRIISMKSTKGETLKLGDDITFSVREMVNMHARGQNPVWTCFGTNPDFPNLEMRFVHKGTEEEVKKYNLWKGKITAFGDANPTSYYAYLGTVTPLSIIETLDGSYLTFGEFMEMTKDGCDHCKAAIEIKDAKKTLISVDDNICLCGECAETWLNETEDNTIVQGAI